uniref:AMP-dependent synthetase/ligase domain-containing protein n=1 Tax=Anopheles epiroticus TaxID=199890 RepID=A0A182PEH7_9DIPT
MGTLPQLAVVKGKLCPLQPTLLHRTFEANVDKFCGTDTALIYNDEARGEVQRNYNELNSTANRLATAMLNRIKDHFRSQPNTDGDYIVAVCLHPTDRLVTTLLAIWKAGAAYLPIDPTFPPNRIQHILGEAKPALVVYDDDYDNAAIFGKTPAISYAELRKRASDLSNANIRPEAMLGKGDSQLALVLYTSGSTGVPKGVRLNHETILNRLQWQWSRFPYSPTERIGVFKTALTFVDSVSEIWGPLLNGMAIVVVPKKITNNPEKLVEVLERYRIERLVLVPTLLRSLLLYLPLQQHQQPRSGSKLLYNLRVWVCSGEPLQISLAREFFDYFQEGVHQLCNFYGSTEVMGDVTYFVCESRKQLESYEKVPIGYPLDNTTIYIMSPDLRPVRTEEIGELYVAGLNLAEGYVNGRDPDRFIDNPLAIDPSFGRLYKTGDYASVSKGCVYYQGRMDSQIKIRGHRVDLSEVEANLLGLAGIDKGIVLCYHAGEIDQALLGFVTLEKDSHFQTGLQVEAALGDKLAHYMIPQVVLLESIPLLSLSNNCNSVFVFHPLPLDDTQIEIEYDYTDVPANRMTAAKDLFETVGQVIGRSTRAKICLASNFYELGGNSLNSIITVTQLCGKGYPISITTFIGAKNMGEILDKICADEQELAKHQLGTNGNGNAEGDFDYRMQLTAHPLAFEHKTDTINIITSSFFEKADLEQWLKPQIHETDYRDILEDIWTVLIEKGLSFIVKDETGRPVGVSLNFDAHDEPEVTVTSKLIIVFEFLEFVEGPIRDSQLPTGKNQILHSFMMGTCAELSAQENIEAMHFMENEVLKLARRRNFAGIFTTNTNPLTQQLGSNVYNYKTMLDYQVNQFVYSADGTRPFAAAPDNQRAVVHWKDIRSS